MATELAADATLLKDTKVNRKNLREYREDVVRMVAYTRDQGLALPADKMENDVAAILSSTSGDLVDKPDIEALLNLHGRLSKIVTPTTPRSLAATEFPLTNYRARGTLLLLVLLSLVAFVGLWGYIITLQPIIQSAATPAPATPQAHAPVVNAAHEAQISPQAGLPVTQYTLQINFLAAAALGSAFAGLITASDYLKNRTFNPQYVPVYVLRLLIGLLAGMILANIGSGLIESDATIAKLGPGIIALLGGYSAQAVQGILDRLVEVLTTLVKGKDDAAAQQRLLAAKDVLAIAQSAADDPTTPAIVREGLASLLKKLQQ